MKLRNLASGLLAAFYFVAPASAEIYRDRTVPIVADANLDVKRYLGLWYEIARFPNSFEKGYQGVTEEYALENDGKISVTNTCRVDRQMGG